MALHMCEVRFNDIEIDFFSKKLQKIAQQLGALPPDPRLWYVWVTLFFSKLLQNYIFALFSILVEALSVCKILVKWKTGKFLMTSLHVICGLSLPIKNSGYAYKLEIAWKTFLKTFFFLENTCGCVLGPWPWPRAFLSLASRGSVLGKAVLGLGLGFFLCPWPWPRALCPRLHLWRLQQEIARCSKVTFTRESCALSRSKKQDWRHITNKFYFVNYFAKK